MVSPMTSSPADRLSFSSFDNMVSYRQHLRYFCRRKKMFFLQIIFWTKTFIFFTKLCMVCYTHTLPKTDRREKRKKKKRLIFFLIYFFFSLFLFPFNKKPTRPPTIKFYYNPLANTYFRSPPGKFNISETFSYFSIGYLIIYSILIGQSLVPSLQHIWKFYLLSMTTISAPLSSAPGWQVGRKVN